MDNNRIASGMRVISRDGVGIGVVGDVEEHGFTLVHDTGGGRHRVGMADVARVDEHVHLGRDAAYFAGRGTAAARTDAPGSPKWLIPLLGLLLLGLLAWGLTQCSKEDDVDDRAAVTTEQGTAVGTGAVAASDQGQLLPALQAYLASAEPAPRTFTFDQLNFDTSEAAIRAEDAPTLKQIAEVLKSHPNARVKIVGYADARGEADANANLGQRRADAVAATLRRAGVAASAVETASGGENNPRDTNATAPGQFENRRTELVVLAK